MLKFLPKNHFFQAKIGFCNFYTNIHEYLKPDLQKFDFRTVWISWKMCKKLKTVDFINMWLFFLESEIFNFCICQKSTFARSYLEQVSSWVIKSKFCVYKVSIRRHFIKLTFSGLHFFILWPPWIFNRGLSNPQWTRIRQNASLCSGARTHSSWGIEIFKPIALPTELEGSLTGGGKI